jgi:hypothetical protein
LPPLDCAAEFHVGFGFHIASFIVSIIILTHGRRLSRKIVLRFEEKSKKTAPNRAG